MKTTTLQLIMTGISAALYTVVGAITYGGFTFYGVRFWPAVIVPTTFAVLFGPWIGGVGAAIGIFLADVIFGHGNAILSVVIGVPSNFLGFAIIGQFSRIKEKLDTQWIIRFIITGCIGLLIGSLYIGYGLVGYSYLYLFSPWFTLPVGFEAQMTIIAGGTITLWTFISEIPFVYLAMVIIRPVSIGFPGLFFNKTEE